MSAASTASSGAKRHASEIVVLLVIVGLLAAPSVVGPQWVDICLRLMILIALTDSWNLLAGYGGLVSLGSAAFVGVGAYVLVEILNSGAAGPAVALLLAACAGAVLAVLPAPAIFRTRGLYFSIGTLAIAEILRLLMLNLPWFGNATGLFFRNDPPSSDGLYYYAASVFVVTQAVISLATMSRVSLLLRAVRDDEDVARQMGVRTFQVKLAVFVAVGALMAMSGGIQAMRQGAVEPFGIFGVNWSLTIAFGAIIGGLGYRLGAIVGVTFSVLLGELLIGYPEINAALTGLLLVVVIRFAPKGLCGLAATGLDRWSQRVVRPSAAAPALTPDRG